LIRADRDSKRVTPITGHNGEPLSMDTDFDPYRHATQVGVVAYPSLVIDSEYLNDNPVKMGDVVLFHHFVCQDDNSLMYNNELLYRCEYFHLFAKIVNTKLEPLEDFIFVEPILEPESNLVGESGLILKSNRGFLDNVGKVFALSKAAKKGGLRMGDVVFFTNNADYDINISGKELYRMRLRNIIGIERSGKLSCLSNKMLVRDITEEERSGGLIYRVNERERIGVVCNIGESIKGVAIGEKVSYFNGLASKLRYDGIDYSFLTTDEINYKYL